MTRSCPFYFGKRYIKHWLEEESVSCIRYIVCGSILQNQCDILGAMINKYHVKSGSSFRHDKLMDERGVVTRLNPKNVCIICSLTLWTYLPSNVNNRVWSQVKRCFNASDCAEPFTRVHTCWEGMLLLVFSSKIFVSNHVWRVLTMLLFQDYDSKSRVYHNWYEHCRCFECHALWEIPSFICHRLR